ncbi:MAG: CCA tRNA nucleotidyltransferase, partial [Phycisphaerae bacterium]|nr:CCA tRNA nucleotidyltransferase [Phycisphaerae bacterium]
MAGMAEAHSKPRSAREAAERVAATLREAGHIALFAGGCVRDLLMGRQPADYDVATDAVPAKVLGLFRRTMQVGAQFGVVVVVLGRWQVEVATFRSEGGYADGRHPGEVHYSDARQDAARRDFTINGMFMDPATGEIVDYVGGRADLEGRLIRAIGAADERLAEDHLRMLRAVRFASTLEFEMEAATAAAVARQAGRIVDVSAERIWQEWEKTIGQPTRARGWRLAEEGGLAAAIWPRLAGQGEAIGERFGRLGATADAVAALATQFAGLAGEAVQEECRRLALDNRSRASVAWLLEHGRDLLEAELEVVPLKKRMANEDWGRLAEVAGALAAEAGERGILAANLAAAGAIEPGEVRPAPLIDGRDVMALGQAEGPAGGRVLAAVYDAQLAEKVR